MHNTSLAKVASDLWPARGKKGGEESHKSLTSGHRVGAPPLNRPPFFFLRLNYYYYFITQLVTRHKSVTIVMNRTREPEPVSGRTID